MTNPFQLALQSTIRSEERLQRLLHPCHTIPKSLEVQSTLGNNQCKVRDLTPPQHTGTSLVTYSPPFQRACHVDRARAAMGGRFWGWWGSPHGGDGELHFGTATLARKKILNQRGEEQSAWFMAFFRHKKQFKRQQVWGPTVCRDGGMSGTSCESMGRGVMRRIRTRRQRGHASPWSPRWLAVIGGRKQSMQKKKPAFLPPPVHFKPYCRIGLSKGEGGTSKE